MNGIGQAVFDQRTRFLRYIVGDKAELMNTVPTSGAYALRLLMVVGREPDRLVTIKEVAGGFVISNVRGGRAQSSLLTGRMSWNSESPGWFAAV
jgi:hypothetical protein